ncbi:hypothetical protein RHMOL_Rhmol02G0057100 [Rhododendron molle]|uniref:Uncharacterized protein n=1 Tax=Rhododendron molle TaxID=49168 RepID=A0ACC0PMD8_RHOML|nr:hypothetical protein RHMOL_Rhmol02G0057100 [Rhododendron molle]
MLEILLLNNNDLSGEIPSTFSKLSSLLACNFSYSDLSGPLLSVKLFQNMAASSFIGNEGLCGGRLGDCNRNPPSCSMQPCLKGGLSATWANIITVLAGAIGLVSLVLIVILLHLMRLGLLELVCCKSKSKATVN